MLRYSYPIRPDILHLYAKNSCLKWKIEEWHKGLWSKLRWMKKLSRISNLLVGTFKNVSSDLKLKIGAVNWSLKSFNLLKLNKLIFALKILLDWVFKPGKTLTLQISSIKYNSLADVALEQKLVALDEVFRFKSYWSF